MVAVPPVDVVVVVVVVTDEDCINPEAKLRSQAAAGESSDGDSGAVLCREVFW